ncbi:TFIIS N-terminal domain-containing protein, partial [Durusdinium trenchii]
MSADVRPRGFGRSRSPHRQLRIEECTAVRKAQRAAIHVTQQEVAEMVGRLKTKIRPSEVLKLLRRLSVAMAPLRGPRLVEWLRATGAGKVVNAMGKSTDSEVSRFAVRLVDAWRQALPALPAPKAAVVVSS